MMFLSKFRKYNLTMTCMIQYSHMYQFIYAVTYVPMFRTAYLTTIHTVMNGNPYEKDQLVTELLQPCLVCHVSVVKLFNRQQGIRMVCTSCTYGFPTHSLLKF